MAAFNVPEAEMPFTEMVARYQSLTPLIDV
jgi:hypothetical protein